MNNPIRPFSTYQSNHLLPASPNPSIPITDAVVASPQFCPMRTRKPVVESIIYVKKEPRENHSSNQFPKVEPTTKH